MLWQTSQTSDGDEATRELCKDCKVGYDGTTGSRELSADPTGPTAMARAVLGIWWDLSFIEFSDNRVGPEASTSADLSLPPGASPLGPGAVSSRVAGGASPLFLFLNRRFAIAFSLLSMVLPFLCRFLLI